MNKNPKFFFLKKYLRSLMRIISFKENTINKDNKMNIFLEGWRISVKEVKRIMTSAQGTLSFRAWKIDFEGLWFPSNFPFKLDELIVRQWEIKNKLISIEALLKAISKWGLKDSLTKISFTQTLIPEDEVIKVVKKYQEGTDESKLFNAEIVVSKFKNNRHR